MKRLCSFIFSFLKLNGNCWASCMLLRWSFRFGYKRKQEKLKKKQNLLYSSVLEAGGTAWRAMWGRTRVDRRQRTGGKGRFRPEPLLELGQARVEQVNRLGLASLNNLSRLWAVRMVPSFLAPGPGMIKAEEHKSDREGLALDWLVCLPEECSAGSFYL